MIIGRYLQWVETAPLGARIDAAHSLVAVYRARETDAYGRADAELALFALLDDPAAVVRRALAEAVADLVDIPHHLVSALAQDHSVVSVPVLWRSPLLDDADLVDAVAIGDAAAQRAVALRRTVQAPVAAAVAEVGDADAVIALCGNENADIMPAAMRRIIDRFRGDGAVREALLARDDLDAAMRHDLVVATAEALSAFAISCAWLSPERVERVTREARDRAAVMIASQSVRRDGPAGPHGLAAHLRQCGHLTPALMLRSILSGNLGLVEAALADLSGMTPVRVAGLMQSAAGLGFASLYAKAGMPPVLLPVFRAALRAIRNADQGAPVGELQRGMVIRTLDACTKSKDPDLGKVAALLRRFEAEAVRDEARAVVAQAWADDTAGAFPALLPWIVASPDAAPRLTFQAAA